jgi:glucose 1-dehydrogenase
VEVVQIKAIAVHPGVPNSMHLREVDRPSVAHVEGGRGVLVQILRCGVDGTDKEINAAAYGEAPPWHDYLSRGTRTSAESSRWAPRCRA